LPPCACSAAAAAAASSAVVSPDYTTGVEGFSYNYYEDLTTADVKGIVDTLRKGGKPKVRQNWVLGWHVLLCVCVTQLTPCYLSAGLGILALLRKEPGFIGTPLPCWAAQHTPCFDKNLA
jgi:hypothetical protein